MGKALASESGYTVGEVRAWGWDGHTRRNAARQMAIVLHAETAPNVCRPQWIASPMGG